MCAMTDPSQRFGTTEAQSTWINKYDAAPRVENMNGVLHVGKVFTEYMPVRSTTHMPLRPQLTSRVEFHWKQAEDFEINRSLVRDTAAANQSGRSKLPDVLPMARSSHSETFRALASQQTVGAKRESCKPSQATIGTVVGPGDSLGWISAAHRSSAASQAAFRRGASYSGQPHRPPSMLGVPLDHPPDAFKSSSRADFGSPFGSASDRAKGLLKSSSQPSGFFRGDLPPTPRVRYSSGFAPTQRRLFSGELAIRT
ncbi:unnamed protein product [Prorocentrum cordatum]|uniref:Uncharacterized protein n=1 Tax=Prorocentrum cordatum TaxID=2364126 RepID=A0ABN9T7Z6_9DINO|nr:unnamed protein product [Polarella glacialis]